MRRALPCPGSDGSTEGRCRRANVPLTTCSVRFDVARRSDGRGVKAPGVPPRHLARAG